MKECAPMRSIIVFIVLLVLNGCSSSQKVIVIKDASEKPAIHQTSYKTFDDAMLNADFDQAEKLSASEEQRECVHAYASFAQGNEATAEQRVLPLIGSKDSVVQNYAHELLSNIYFSQGKWTALRRLCDQAPVDSGAYRVLSTAYATLPKEEIRIDASNGTIPLTFSSSGTPIVEVEINGVKKHFWFDTGAGLTVIASDVAEECSIAPIGAVSASSGTSTSKTVGILPCELSQFTIGGLSVAHHPAMIIAKENLEFKLWGMFTVLKIDGIIGWNLMQQLGWVLDYKNKTLLPLTSEKSVRSPIGNLSWFGYPIVSVSDSGGTSLLFGMDTGAKTSSLTKHFIVKTHVHAGPVESTTSGGAGGWDRVQVEEVNNVTLFLPGNKVFFPKIFAHDREYSSTMVLHGILGSDIAKEGRLVLDYPHRSIILE
jgi:hypothetical protein